MAETAYQRARDANDLIERMEPPEKVSNMLPKMLKMVPALMFAGFIVVLAAFGMSIVTADHMGNAVGLMDPDNPQPSEAQEERRSAAELQPLIAPLAFVGMALLLFGITITLMAIAGALRTMGSNVVGLILEHEAPE